MRHIGFTAIALIAIACGPDPNAQLPGSSKRKTPNAGSGGAAVQSGTGGATPASTSSGGSGGSNPFGDGGAGGSFISATGGSGGSSPFDRGGTPGSTGGGASGGLPGSGGGVGSGGSSTSGGGGSTVASTTYAWGVGPEPCASPKDLSCASGGNGTTGNFGNTTDYCFRTGDTFLGWGCSNLSGWTLLVNGQPVTCSEGGTNDASKLPPKLNGLYYFHAIGSSGAKDYAAVYWWGTCVAGPYPAWSGGGASTPVDAGATSDRG